MVQKNLSSLGSFIHSIEFLFRRRTFQTGLNGQMLTMSKISKRRNENLEITLIQMIVSLRW